MSKRNFILLIIILGLAVVATVGVLYFRETSSLAPAEESVGTNFFSQFNPFGTSKPAAPTSPTPEVVDVQTNEGAESPEIPKGKLVKVSSMPVAGFTVFQKERLKEIAVPPPTEGDEAPLKKVVAPPPTEFVGALRYVERATGNIYQTFVDKIEERKFSGTTIPRVYEAYFGSHGQLVVMRYLKTGSEVIETFIGTLPKEYLGGDTVENNEIKGSFLASNVTDISVSPDTQKIFYLFKSGDNIVGTTLNLLDNKKVQIFDSPFTEWLSGWGDNKTVTLSTKPSFNIPGYMYMVDTSKKNLTKVLSDIKGLTTLTSPDGKFTLYSQNDLLNSLSLNVYRSDTKNAIVLGIRTLPEKCVWGKGSDILYCAVPKFIDFGTYPDTWYQGEVSFRDEIWKIDIKSGNTTLVLNPALVTGGEEVDGIKLALDEGENYLFFINKKDSHLWKLELK